MIFKQQVDARNLINDSMHAGSFDPEKFVPSEIKFVDPKSLTIPSLSIPEISVHAGLTSDCSTSRHRYLKN